MALNIQALRVFAAVADAGSFSRGAVRLRLSQPAVSKAIGVLERQQGLLLLERGSRTIRLTDAGAALYERAIELFAVERSAEEELQSRRTLGLGTLRVGASTTIATYLLPAALRDFREQHPGIRLRVSGANTRDIARWLLLRRLDVAMVEGPVDDARIEAVAWLADELIVIAPPDHFLAIQAADGRELTVADLNACQFIGRERGSGTRTVTEAALVSHGIKPVVILHLSSTEAVKQSVAAGLGIAILSRAAAADQLALGTVRELPIANLRLSREFTILKLKGRLASPGARAFEQMLLDRGGKR